MISSNFRSIRHRGYSTRFVSAFLDSGPGPGECYFGETVKTEKVSSRRCVKKNLTVNV